MSNSVTIETPTNPMFSSYGDIISETSKKKLPSFHLTNRNTVLIPTDRQHVALKQETTSKQQSFASKNEPNKNEKLIRKMHEESGDEASYCITNGNVRFGLASDEKLFSINEPLEAQSQDQLSSGINSRNYDDVVNIAKTVRRLAHLIQTPELGIICGSGLGSMADLLSDTRQVPFSSIPGFPRPSVVGHKGNLIFGWLNGTYVMCMQGRFHPYEHGMDLAFCSMPVRVMHMLGVQTLFVSNAAGGVNSKYRHGDIMIIKDHISMPALVGFGPLVGLNDPSFGPRFVSLHDAYDKQIRTIALSISNTLGVPVREGVYLMNGGPQYETPAEIAFLKLVGADAVGMSTCHEVIVARQCGMRVFGFSLITNICSTNVDSAVEVSHEEVIQTGCEASERACKFVSALVAKLSSRNLNAIRVPHVDSYVLHDEADNSQTEKA